MALLTVGTFLSTSALAEAIGLSSLIVAGVSGPYEYQVGLGLFSPLRRDLLVGVTLNVDGNPVTHANVTFTIASNGSFSPIGPLNATNTLTHVATYEVSLQLPELPRDIILFSIAVDSQHGPAQIEAVMFVPDVVESSHSDSYESDSIRWYRRWSSLANAWTYTGLALAAVVIGAAVWTRMRAGRRR